MYRVVITKRAKNDLRDYLQVAARHAPLTAARWLARFEGALSKLGSYPHVNMLAPENGLVDGEIRQLLFGKRPNVFRALFTISTEEVRVLHIRRASMDVASAEDLQEL